MADMKDGFSVSFKAGADMLTVQGVDYATFKKNLEELFADEERPSSLLRFTGGSSAEAVALANVKTVLGATEEATPTPVASVDSGGGTAPVDSTPTGEADGTHEYEVCNSPTANGPCGSLKNEWKPGGKRANGSTYQGFWGCPAWKNHLKSKRS